MPFPIPDEADPDRTRIDLPPLVEGQTIGPYRLLRTLGEGGMGIVYLAEQDQPLRRKVAVKLVKLGMDTKQVIARFDSERQALAILNHPNVARVFDAGATPEGRPYFVMEYVSGVPITHYCDQNRVDTRRRLEIFIQACEGIQHAHQKGILHRDIKPSNVLVTLQDDKPVPKIIDFGIAKATARSLTDSTFVTELGQAIGTPAYMSPEQAGLVALDVDTRSDVYSLGVMLYELLVGVLPIDPGVGPRLDLDRLRQRIRDEEPSRPSERVSVATEAVAATASCRRTDPLGLRRQLRGDLDWIVLKSLDKDRTRRYASASELAADIGRHLRHEPVLASPPSPLYRTLKFIRRHRVGVGASGLLLLAMLAGIGGTTVGLIQARRAERRANEEAETAHQVSEFLVELFKVSTPGDTRATAISAREILDRGARRIRGELAANPLVQARLMATMGRVYGALGVYEEARPLLEESLAIRREQLGPHQPELAESLNSLGTLRREQHDVREARSLYEEALAIRERALGPNHPDVASTLINLGLLLREMGDIDAARPLLERAVTILEGAMGPDDPLLATALGNLALVHFNTGDYGVARSLLERAVAIEEKSFGPVHAEVGRSLAMLAVAWERSGELGKALPLYERAAKISESVLGPDHPALVEILDNLGQLLAKTGDDAGARRAYERALAISEKALGPEHPSVAWTLGLLGDSLVKGGALREGRAILERALAIQEAHLGIDHPDVAWTLRSFAELDAASGDLAGGRARYDRAVAILEKALGAEHPDLIEMLEGYAGLLRRYGDVAGAAALDARCQAIRARGAGG